MISTPEKPFLFIFSGTIPALKNGREWNGTTLRSSPEVDNWYKDQKTKLPQQRELQKNLDNIDIAFCVFEYFAKDAEPNGDLDNCYTTAQEALQPMPDPSVKRKGKGILGVIKNDKQVRGYLADTLPLSDQQPIPGAYFWLWEYDSTTSRIAQLQRFETFRQRNLNDRLNKSTVLSRFCR